VANRRVTTDTNKRTQAPLVRSRFKAMQPGDFARAKPNVQGGGWSRFGRERCRAGTRSRSIVDHELRISSGSTAVFANPVRR
jgi:hypothetical protein